MPFTEDTTNIEQVHYTVETLITGKKSNHTS